MRINLPNLHPGQRFILDNAARFNVVACGRRFGKSVLGAERLLYHALVNGQDCAYVTPTYRMGADMYEQLATRLTPVIKHRHKGERLRLQNGVQIDLWAVTPNIADRIRGRKYGLIVVDEAAMIEGLKRIYETVLRPTLADHRGGGWFLSTPKGMNDFYELFERGIDENAYPEWWSYTAPTSDNPHISPDEIEAMRNELSELVFYQELLAQFLSLEGAVFRYINEAVVETDSTPVITHTYVAGFDIARVEGGDYSVITVYDVTNGQVVFVDRFGGASFELQIGRVIAVDKKYNIQSWLIDATGIGMPMLERLQKEVNCRGIHFTQQIKQHLIERLAFAFENRSIKIPQHKVLINELLSFVSERAQMGGVKYGAPKGSHDDCVISLALAYQAGFTPEGARKLVY